MKNIKDNNPKSLYWEITINNLLPQIFLFFFYAYIVIITTIRKTAGLFSAYNVLGTVLSVLNELLHSVDRYN